MDSGVWGYRVFKLWCGLRVKGLHGLSMGFCLPQLSTEVLRLVVYLVGQFSK